jgi:FAD/FMN-containing dehydrogenase
MDSGESARCIAWAQESFAAMEPFRGEAGYVNYLEQDETSDRVAAAYGPNYHRLRELKTQYDPSNFFQGNQNIRPLR